MSNHSMQPSAKFKSLEFLPEGKGYTINQRGSVRSYWKIKGNGMRHGTSAYLSDSWRKKKPTLANNGYLTVMLSGKWYPIHKLLLLTFVGPCPDGMDCCRHLDGNPLNNSLKNLCWGTSKQNGEDRVRHGTSARGVRHGMAKLKEEQVKQIRKLYGTGNYSQRKLAKIFKVTQPMIGYIVRKESWKYI